MTNSIFTIENGIQLWDLSACETDCQFMFFDGLLNRDAENSYRVNEIRLEREGAAVVNDYIDPPKIASFGHYA